MKICWDAIEDLYLTRRGNLKKNNVIYIEMDSCKHCGYPYLMAILNPTLFCGVSCAMTGKKLSDETRLKMSISRTGRIGPMLGKKHSRATRNKLSLRLKGRKFSLLHSMNKSKAQIGSNNPNWKGGVDKLNLPLFETYASQLSYAEVIRNNDNLLEVRCAYCGGWFIPTRQSVINRIRSLEGHMSGEHRLYCSDTCKEACPIYNQKLYPKGFKPATSREVQPELRQLVFERDNYTCQKCGKTVDQIQIHCHHMDPVSQNPIESADIDICITLCKICHKEVHKQSGCKYNELRCN